MASPVKTGLADHRPSTCEAAVGDMVTDGGAAMDAGLGIGLLRQTNRDTPSNPIAAAPVIA